MRKYKCENWSMVDIANAIKGLDEQGRRIVVPMFQRGKRWNNEKRCTFVDSLLKGYPVGTLLFAEQEGKRYSVIDGLQRSITISEYILNPTKRENLKNIDESILSKCRNALFPDNNNLSINKKIAEIIYDYIAGFVNFDEIEVGDIAQKIIEEIKSEINYKKLLTEIKAILRPWFFDYKKDFNLIKETEIPIIIYSGDTEFLNDIFRRINEQGEKLNDYEIYAATWLQDKIKINNNEIINNVIKKYDCLALDNIEYEGYDSTQMKRTKELTVFEFLFGFGKYLVNEFDFLNLDKNLNEDQVTTMSFELIDACLNNSKHVADLDKILYNRSFDINLFERRIVESVKFVANAISPINDFKGNRRKNKFLHPKFFILALIAFVFREMYNIDNLEVYKTNWNSNKKIISKRILHHYIYELVKNDWHDGGIGKMYVSIKERSFMEEINKKSWDSLLNNYFEQSLRQKQTERFSSPSNADNILLNCIYANIFTANQQLSKNNLFDIEHLATKDKMKKIIKTAGSMGLPVSSIANLCYLPADMNRSKHEKTIYEDTNLSISIIEIETKYSFTRKSDLDFLNLPYQNGDVSDLENVFNEYLTTRFKIQKNKIYEFLEL